MLIALQILAHLICKITLLDLFSFLKILFIRERPSAGGSEKERESQTDSSEHGDQCGARSHDLCDYGNKSNMCRTEI